VPVLIIEVKAAIKLRDPVQCGLCVTSLTARLNGSPWDITQLETMKRRVLGVLWGATSLNLLHVGENGIESCSSEDDKEIIHVLTSYLMEKSWVCDPHITIKNPQDCILKRGGQGSTENQSADDQGADNQGTDDDNAHSQGTGGESNNNNNNHNIDNEDPPPNTQGHESTAPMDSTTTHEQQQAESQSPPRNQQKQHSQVSRSKAKTSHRDHPFVFAYQTHEGDKIVAPEGYEKFQSVSCLIDQATSQPDKQEVWTRWKSDV